MLTHFSPQLPAERPFIIRVDTTKAGSANDTFILPLHNTFQYSFIVNWGDGAIERVTVNSPVTHIYPAPGIYTISVYGARGKYFPYARFYGATDVLKLIEIVQWGDIIWRNFSSSFWTCANLANIPKGPFNTKGSSTLNNIFAGCPLLNSDVSNIDTSSISNMASMFYGCTIFNQPINFFNTENVSNMGSMLRDCPAFKQDLSSLKITSLTTAQWFLLGSNINDTGTTTRYDALLNSWAGQSFRPNVQFHGGSSKYSAAASAARAKLVAAGWTIGDGGLQT